MSQKQNGKASMGHSAKRDSHHTSSNDEKVPLAVLRVSQAHKPELVIKFLHSMYLHSLKDCSSSNIDRIFGENGSSGEYPVNECPADPDDADNKVEFKKWDHAYGNYIKKEDALTADKLKLYATMVQQMSDESFVLIQENTVGSKAMSEKCPKKLIEAIIFTHMSDSKVSSFSSLHQALKAYNGPANTMANLSLSDYFTKFKSLIENIKISSNRISTPDFMDDSVPGDQLQALKFLDGLNSGYNQMCDNYDQNLKAVPTTLSAAYLDASNFKVKVKQFPIEKEIMITNKNMIKGKNKNNGKSSGIKHLSFNEYGGRKGNCNNCGEAGHYLKECKKPVKVAGQQTKVGESNVKTV